MTDQDLSQLMAAAQDGDEGSYGKLLDHIADLIRRFVTKRLFNDSHVEDIVQEILLNIHRARHTYHPSRPFLPWMYTIARHRLYDALRITHKRSMREVYDETQLDSASYSIDMGERKDQLSDDIEGAMMKLSSAQQQIIRLHKVQGYSLQEISDKMEMSLSATKVAAHRGYKALKKLLGGHYEN